MNIHQHQHHLPTSSTSNSSYHNYHHHHQQQQYDNNSYNDYSTNTTRKQTSQQQQQQQHPLQQQFYQIARSVAQKQQQQQQTDFNYSSQHQQQQQKILKTFVPVPNRSSTTTTAPIPSRCSASTHHYQSSALAPPPPPPTRVPLKRDIEPPPQQPEYYHKSIQTPSHNQQSYYNNAPSSRVHQQQHSVKQEVHYHDSEYDNSFQLQQQRLRSRRYNTVPRSMSIDQEHPPQEEPSKRALLVGVTYDNHNSKLEANTYYSRGNNMQHQNTAITSSKSLQQVPVMHQQQHQYQEEIPMRRSFNPIKSTNSNSSSKNLDYYQQQVQYQQQMKHKLQQQQQHNPDQYHELNHNNNNYNPSSSTHYENENELINAPPTFIGSMNRQIFIDVLTSYVNNLIEMNERAQLLLTSPEHSEDALDMDMNENNDFHKYSKHYNGHGNHHHHRRHTNTPVEKIKKIYSQNSNNPSPTSILGVASSPCTSSSSSSSTSNTSPQKMKKNVNCSNIECADDHEKNSFLPDHLQPESVFFSITKPTISTLAYITRIVSYTQCSPSVFIIMLIYLKKIGQVNEKLKVTNYNLHRLLITSLMLACKWVDDITFTMQHYGKIGGIPTSKEMERLEIQFLKYLDFNMHVPVEDYYTMLHDLDSLALNLI